MALDGNQLREVARLNLEPINQIAGEVLPPGWKDGTTLYVLSLAWWGLEQGLVADPDVVEGVLHFLGRLSPERAMFQVQGTDEEPGLYAEDLEDLDLETAASRVLDRLMELAS